MVLEKESKITLILGPSCSGKSTYINDKYKNHKVLMGYDLVHNPVPKGRVIIHYNSFRPYGKSFKNLDFISDVALRKIITSNRDIEAIFLCCSEQTLIERAQIRKFVEPNLRQSSSSYPTRMTLHFLKHIDLDKHYKAWQDFLNKQNILTTYIDSNNSFKEVPEKYTSKI